MKKTFYTYPYIALIFFGTHLSFIDISLFAGEFDREIVKNVLFNNDVVPYTKNQFNNLERHLLDKKTPKSWTMKYSNGEEEAFLPCNVLGLIEASDIKKTKKEKEKLLVEWLLVIKSVAKLEKYKPLLGKFLLFYELNQCAIKLYKAQKKTSSFQDLLNIFSVSQINSGAYFSGFSQAIRRDIGIKEYDKILNVALRDIHITMFEQTDQSYCRHKVIMTAPLSGDYKATITNIPERKRHPNWGYSMHLNPYHNRRVRDTVLLYNFWISKEYGIEDLPQWSEKARQSWNKHKWYQFFVHKNFFVITDEKIDKKAIFPLFNRREESIVNVFCTQYLLVIMYSKHNTYRKKFYKYPVKSAQQQVKKILNAMHTGGFLSAEQHYCHTILVKNNILDISCGRALMNSVLRFLKKTRPFYLPFCPWLFIPGYSMEMMKAKTILTLVLAFIEVFYYMLSDYKGYSGGPDISHGYVEIREPDIEVTKKE